MKILLIPGLTLLGFADEHVARIRAAAGREADVIVTTPAEAYEHAEDAEVILQNHEPLEGVIDKQLGY